MLARSKSVIERRNDAWFRLSVPADMKMAPPEHHAIASDDVPVLSDLSEGVRVRLFAGSLAGRSGPAPLGTPVLIAHVELDAGSSVTLPAERDWAAGFCVVAGSVDLPGTACLEAGATPVFNNDGDTITVGSTSGGEVLLMVGQPIGEPIAMGGGFVMNTAAEIERAFSDYDSGAMGTLTPSR